MHVRLRQKGYKESIKKLHLLNELYDKPQTSFFPMKSIIYSLLILMLPIRIVAQAQPTTNPIQIDARLFEVYDKDYLETVKKEDPDLLQRWHFYLDNAFVIADNSLSKTHDGDKPYPSVSIPDLTHINILKLEQEQHIKNAYYTEVIYKIQGTDKYLVYIAGRHFMEKLNEYFRK